MEKEGEGVMPQVRKGKVDAGSWKRATLRRKSVVKLVGSSRSLKGLW